MDSPRNYTVGAVEQGVARPFNVRAGGFALNTCLRGQQRNYTTEELPLFDGEARHPAKPFKVGAAELYL